MLRRVVFWTGLVIACLLIGQFALNASGVGKVVLDKTTADKAQMAKSSPKDADALAKAEADRNATQMMAPQQRKALEEAARAAGWNPGRLGEVTSADLQAFLQSKGIATVKTVQPSKAERPAAPAPLSPAEREAVQANATSPNIDFEAAQTAQVAGSAPNTGATLPAGSPLSGEAQKAALEATEKSATALTPSYEPLVVPEAADEIADDGINAARAARLQSLQQRANSGTDLRDSEKTELTILAEDPELSSPRPVGSLDNSGADSWGYAFADNIAPDTATYDWIELRGDGSATWFTMSGLDAGNAPWAQIGFSFPFYGVNRDSFKLYNDGNIQFGPTLTASYTNGTLPSTNMPSAALLPFWDDLQLARAGGTATDRIAFRNFGTYAVIEWDSVGLYNTSCAPAQQPSEV